MSMTSSPKLPLKVLLLRLTVLPPWKKMPSIPVLLISVPAMVTVLPFKKKMPLSPVLPICVPAMVTVLPSNEADAVGTGIADLRAGDGHRVAV